MKLILLILLTIGLQSLVLAQGMESFHLGLDSLTAGEKEKAQELFRKAASQWEQDKGLDSLYNAGTSWALAGSHREAMVDLRSYLDQQPFSWDAQENIKKLRTEAGLTTPSGLWEFKTLVLWVLSWLISLAVGLFLVALASDKGNLLGKLKMPLGLSILGLSLTLGGLYLWTPQVAILGTETQARIGDGEIYEGLEGGPWKSGQELVLGESRWGWVRAQSGTQWGWIPENVLIPLDKKP